MAMRTNCRFYESRTYAAGEVVQKCRLDQAPEAPWRCPDDCPIFELRRIDVGWQVGSTDRPVADAGPEPEGEDIAALLDAAEDIINSAAPDILAELDGKGKKRFGRKKKDAKRRKKRG